MDLLFLVTDTLPATVPVALALIPVELLAAPLTLLGLCVGMWHGPSASRSATLPPI